MVVVVLSDSTYIRIGTFLIDEFSYQCVRAYIYIFIFISSTYLYLFPIPDCLLKYDRYTPGHETT